MVFYQGMKCVDLAFVMDNIIIHSFVEFFSRISKSLKGRIWKNVSVDGS